MTTGLGNASQAEHSPHPPGRFLAMPDKIQVATSCHLCVRAFRLYSSCIQQKTSLKAPEFRSLREALCVLSA